MKKLSKLVALAVSLIVATFVGCSDISSDEGLAANGYKDAKSSYVSKALTLNVSSNSDLIDFSTSALTDEGARTIAPEALDSDGVKFYLGGTDLVTNKPVPVQEVTFAGKSDGGSPATISKTEGTITVDLQASNYRFVLLTYLASATQPTITATTEITTLIPSAVLIGYATADLRYTEEAASVNFVLTSDGLTGDGKLDLSLYLDKWSEASLALTKDSAGTKVIATATVGLYDVSTGAEITGTLANADFTGMDGTADAKFKHYYGTSANSVVTDIDSGTYDLTVTFTLKNGKKYIFSDKVIILPGQTTAAEIGIPEVIELPPEAPSDFKVGYSIPATTESDYYNIIFNWTDNSNNELYFELDLWDVTDDTNVNLKATDIGSTGVGAKLVNQAAVWTNQLNATPWTKPKYKTYANADVNPSLAEHVSTVFYGLKVDNGPSWYAGSLNRNNEYAIFTVELGKQYLARIRAVNVAGDSEYAIIKVNDNGLIDATANNNKNDVYCAPASTTYTVPTGESTAQTAILTADEGTGATTPVKVYAFNTPFINLFRMKYELVGGTLDPSNLAKVYYFDQLPDGNPVMQPDGNAKVGLATDIINSNPLIYNGTAGSPVTLAAVTLKYGTGSSAKPWTNWTMNSIDTKNGDLDNVWKTGAKLAATSPVIAGFPSGKEEYEAATSWAATGVYFRNAGTTSAPIYVPVALTSDPGSGTNGIGSYFIRNLPNYMGHNNIVFYANYTSSTFGVKLQQVADYTIENNLAITASADGDANAKLRYNGTSAIEENASVDVLKMSPGAGAGDPVSIKKVQYIIVDRTVVTTGAPPTTVKTKNLKFAYVPNTAATNGKAAFGQYDKIELEFIQQGSAAGTSVGVYYPSSNAFTIPLGNFKAGTYIATIKAYTSAINTKAPFEYSVYIQLND